jgi:hypothetical protein
MPLVDDDYLPSSAITRGKNGLTLNRSFYFLDNSDLEAIENPLIPEYNSIVNIPQGSAGTDLYLTSINVTNTGDGANDQLWFRCELAYEQIVGDNTPVLDAASWTTSLSPRQITIAAKKGQTHYPATSVSPLLYDGDGINVTENGAEGISIDESMLTLTVKHWIGPANISEYLAGLYALADHVNAAAFAGPWGTWAAKTVRYTGFNLTHINGEIDQVSHEFLYVPNASVSVDLLLYPGTTVSIPKAGHEYLWISVMDMVDPEDDTKHIREALSAHLVKDLYPEGDFSVFDFPF